ncbi:hypothetical protein GCM10010218_47040 [Streptomyces mashuensis]|uniref:DUF1360 domain-containing protein n=1 Tax=Streptomyces mashuensis TaxID=33904 RepID=A0A919B6N6_9ACTN|nr:DUF1360 domain-containing protein [Streptomyces mashuensis]GHF60051.1 hypothetical protein GCM10010218_47040 [Streptomyces mashuensis]
MSRANRPGRAWWTRVRAGYEEGADEAGGERPLAGYVLLLGAYSAFAAGLACAVRRWGSPGARPAAGDLALVAVAAFQSSRTLAKDAVTSPLRAPFTTYRGTAGPGEVTEAPRPGPVRHAVGELLSCPLCMAQWTATAGVAGLALCPRATRWATAGLTAVAAADVLHFGYARLQQAAE